LIGGEILADRISPEERSVNMSRIRSKDTLPELMIRKALWKAGMRYRKHYGPFKIDIAFPSRKVAVFIDGCFWHGCPIHGCKPKSNEGYWLPKLERNQERDRTVQESLESLGWLVIRIWEHDASDVQRCVEMITLALNAHTSDSPYLAS
jgi:DNA mismatch endonuclease (patch repair protein)